MTRWEKAEAKRARRRARAKRGREDRDSEARLRQLASEDGDRLSRGPIGAALAVAARLVWAGYIRRIEIRSGVWIPRDGPPLV